MSQIDFFVCNSERRDLLSLCLGNGLTLIPDMHYQDNSYMSIKDFDGLELYNDNSPKFYLTSQKFTFYPFKIDSVINSGRLIYYIVQRQGGPYIDFFTPVLGEVNNNIIGPGFVGIFPFYYNGLQKIHPNQEFIKAYKELVIAIKKISVKVTLGRRTFWIGKETVDLVKRGKVRLLPISGVDIATLI
ncbi:hypothetical protein LZZ85_28180 [Terrimonas sp. NA20]|uniref:Uncharacterized protein n=1 Tax=Terrimonas ginsenosidimutans TaxID=2908004 RepID=A0ABS9L0U8_9BACT|nr:hypothetical protein [Terrimonas ginsenosidimutans]MCG2618206.1 hypothetical protein [Terrimonas ginsenosidimutans]